MQRVAVPVAPRGGQVRGHVEDRLPAVVERAADVQATPAAPSQPEPAGQGVEAARPGQRR